MVLSIAILTFQGIVAALSYKEALSVQQRMLLVVYVYRATSSFSLYITWRCRMPTFSTRPADSVLAAFSHQLFRGPCSTSSLPNMIYIQVPRASDMPSHKPTYTGTSLYES